jgi:hypothetical protein
VFHLERAFKEKLSKVGFKLQQANIKIFAQAKSLATIINFEDESDESQKTFYLLSLILLISLIFLSPDKVPQTFSQGHPETGILEKMQEVTKIFKKLMSNLV